mgnify:CR=1 FL=1
MVKNLSENQTKQDLEEKLNEKLINFAKKHDSIIAITRGCDPEEDFEVYYFIIRGRNNPELDDEITDLDLSLNNDYSYNCNLSQWPSCDLSAYPFLGEFIYKVI